MSPEWGLWLVRRLGQPDGDRHGRQVLVLLEICLAELGEAVLQATGALTSRTSNSTARTTDHGHLDKPLYVQG